MAVATVSRIYQNGPHSIEVKAFPITVWSPAQFMSAAGGRGWMNRWLCTSEDLCKQNAALYLEKKYTHHDQLQQEALHRLLLKQLVENADRVYKFEPWWKTWRTMCACRCVHVRMSRWALGRHTHTHADTAH